MRRLIQAAVTATLLLVGPTVAPVGAAGLVVDTLVDAAADDGACALREAITAANTDSPSGVSPGECSAGSGADVITFSVAGTIVLTGPLPDITSDLTIDGAGAITVDGDDAHRPFTIGSGTVTLDGLTVTRARGHLDGWSGPYVGGAITILFGATLTVTDSTISGNTGYNRAGGIFSEGTLIVTDSTISGNSRGGIWNEIAGAFTVTHSTISGNTDGGILNEGTLTVTDSTISDNAAVYGAGIHTYGPTIVTGSTISGNTASNRGGGILLDGGPLTVTNSTISGNTAGRYGSGGGIEAGGPTVVTNSTISGNRAGSGGGGIAGGSGGELWIRNTIVVGNSGDDVRGGVDDQVIGSIVGLPVGLALADVLDPAGLAENGGPTRTIALVNSAANPAIDGADPAICAAAPVNGIDQRGLPRAADTCDIGAFEVQGVLASPSSGPTAQPSPSLSPSPSRQPTVEPSPSGNSGTVELTPPPTEAQAETPLTSMAPLQSALLVVLVTGLLAAFATRRAVGDHGRDAHVVAKP